MLCENCKQNEATVYVSKIINGRKTEHYLCDHCVEEHENSTGEDAILFNNFISELMKIALEEGYLKSPQTPIQKTCSYCGLTLKEFLEIGRFGCKECYTVFNNELKNAFINVHGNAKHVGKMLQPHIEMSNQLGVAEETKSSDGLVNQEAKISALQEALNKAIKEEAYEQAAYLRDKIKALKKEGTH